MDNTANKIAQGVSSNSSPEAKNSKLNLNQQDFLNLMLTQIKYQDPLNPMKGNEFFSQLAQISTAKGINELQSSFKELSTSLQSNQALQASALVDSSVLVQAKTVFLDAKGKGVEGAVELANSSGTVKLTISNASGESVRQINLGPQPKGLAYFTWDGMDNKGNRVAAGNYHITAQAKLDDKAVSQDTFLFSRVESVTFSKNKEAILLNLANKKQVDFADVRALK